MNKGACWALIREVVKSQHDCMHACVCEHAHTHVELVKKKRTKENPIMK